MAAQVVPDPLEIQAGDAYIELTLGGEGFNLYIKAVPGLGSVLISESSADPQKRVDSFAFRAWDYNPVNGDERRILDGEFLNPETPLYFLVDSTPQPNELLGLAYQIYIPYALTYGYPWSREGQVEVHQGTWLNIRAFEKPYADYRGAWRDNPFVLSMKGIPQAPVPPPPGNIPPLASEKKSVTQMGEILESLGGHLVNMTGSLDMVLVLDTTISMKDELVYLGEHLVPYLETVIGNIESYRIGIVFYRDYKEAYLTRNIPYMSTLEEIQWQLDVIEAAGGRDIPEAVNEGLYASLTEFSWESPNRIILQIGDADGHIPPRGAITPGMVEEEALRQNVSIFQFKLPDR